jgi:NADP-dependent 3-hydroxy acid dehydrogenase YdfG/Flp pilus assembly protein TadD
MSTNSIALAYCADNEATIQEIERQLQASSYTFHHYNCNRSTNNTFLADQLLGQSDPILLFISDNFLKSAQCMSQSLKLLQERRHDILPIIIDGITQDEQTGETVKVTTDFERVSDIIQYINYWQDRYLDLRREKRQIEGLDEDKFNAHLKVMREISSEAGEFLRMLRSLNYLSLAEFSVNHFEQFFIFTEDRDGWVHYKSAAHSYQPEQLIGIPPQTVTEQPEAPAEEPQAEEAEEPIEIADIPGIDLLNEREESSPADPQPDPSPEPASMPNGDEPTELSEEENEHDDGVPAHRPVEEQPQIESMDNGPDDFIRPEEETEEQTEEASLMGDAQDLWEVQGSEQETGIDEQEEEAPVLGDAQDLREMREAEEEADEAAIVERALTYFNQGAQSEGLQYMAEAVTQNADNASLRYHYALMLAQQGDDYSAARRELEPVIEMEPDNTDALFLLGELEELEGAFDDARKHYLQLVDIAPKYPNAYYRLGMITAAHFPDDRKDAAKYFKQAAKQDKTNHDALYQYALLLNEVHGKPKKAVKYFRKTLKINAFHPFAYYDMALVYHQEGEYEKAADAYEKAIRINPELKTPENDLAFQVPEPVEQPKAETEVQGEVPDFNYEALDALKQSIAQLEEMLQTREEESLQLREQLQEKTEAKVPARPKVDQTVLITGATSGIGRATAERFAEAGYRVIMTGRRVERLEALKAEFVEQYEADVLTLSFDLRSQQETKEALATLDHPWSQIDLLINNAGKAKGLAPIHEGELEHWEEMIDTNLKGLLYLTRLIAPNMVERQKGQIINVCSTAGKEVYPNGNVYCATKAAVDSLTKAMRIDLHQHNVRVGMISPAHVDETEFALVRFDGDSERASIYDDFKPLSSRDVADTIYFMATQPAHVNILDVVLQGTQQAHSMIIDRSGRARYEEEE